MSPRGRSELVGRGRHMVSAILALDSKLTFSSCIAKMYRKLNILTIFKYLGG